MKLESGGPSLNMTVEPLEGRCIFTSPHMHINCPEHTSATAWWRHSSSIRQGSWSAVQGPGSFIGLCGPLSGFTSALVICPCLMVSWGRVSAL